MRFGLECLINSMIYHNVLISPIRSWLLGFTPIQPNLRPSAYLCVCIIFYNIIPIMSPLFYQILERDASTFLIDFVGSLNIKCFC